MDIASTSVDVLNGLCAGMKEMAEVFDKACSVCLSDYTPTAGKPSIATPTTSLAERIFNCFVHLLGQILVKTADRDSVNKWIIVNHGERTKLVTICSSAVQAERLFAQASRYKVMSRCSAIVRCIQAAHSFCVEEAAYKTPGKCSKVVAELQEAFAPIETDLLPNDHALVKGMADFRLSPFLAVRNEFMTKLAFGFRSDALPRIKPVADLVSKVLPTFPRAPLRGIEFGKMSNLELKKFAEWTVGDKPFSEGCQWALTFQDSILHKQLSFLHCSCVALRAVAVLQEHVNENSKGRAKTYANKNIAKDHIAKLHDVRRAVKNVKEQLARLSGQSDKLTAMQQVLHCDLLDRSIFAAEVQKSIVAQSEALQAQVAAVWKADVDSLKAHLRGMCPKWESKRESLLTEDVLCKELLSNTANYAKIGPVAEELRYWGKEFRKLHGDNAGVLLPLEWLKEIGSAADFGIETVAFTYVIAHVRNEFRKLQGNAVQLADSIQALKKKITEEHRVQLTPQMEEYFTDFIEGRRRGTEHEQEDPARASAFAPFTVQPQSPGRGSAPSDDTTVDEGNVATPRTKDSRDSSSTPRTSQGTPLQRALPTPSQRASKRRRFGDSLKA